MPLTGCPRAIPARRAGSAPLDFWLRVGSATPTGKPGMTLTRPWGAVAEAGKTQVRTPHLRPRRGGGSRASGGRQRGCGHYPRGSRRKVGQAPDWSECAPWNLHEATGRRLPRALVRTGKDSAGRLLRPRGDAKGGNALWRAFASFWRVPKGWRRAGAQPRRAAPGGDAEDNTY